MPPDETINSIIERAVREAVEAVGLRPPPRAMHEPDALLTRAAAAEALTKAGFKVAYKTLATMATRGGGPPFRRYGLRVLHRWADLIAWAEGRLSPPARNTAEAGSARGLTRPDPETAA